MLPIEVSATVSLGLTLTLSFHAYGRVGGSGESRVQFTVNIVT
jgi:hypothetical protein